MSRFDPRIITSNLSRFVEPNRGRHRGLLLISNLGWSSFAHFSANKAFT